MQRVFVAFEATHQQEIAAILPDRGTLAGRQARTLALCCAAASNCILFMQYLEWRDPVSLISYAGGTALAAACAAGFALDVADSYSPSTFDAALWLLARGSRLADGSVGLAGDSSTLPALQEVYVVSQGSHKRGTLRLPVFAVIGFAVDRRA